MELKINYEETIAVGNQITTKSQAFRDLLSEINNINLNLQSAWEGTDAAKYTRAVAEQAQYMEKLALSMEEIGTFLCKVGGAYKEVSESNASAING